MTDTGDDSTDADSTGGDGDAAGIGQRLGLDLRLTALVALCSVVAMAPLFRVSLTMDLFLGMAFAPLLNEVLPVLALVPLPAAVIAATSKERFRRESLGTLAALGFVGQGPLFKAVAAGLVVGGIFTSYKAKSVFNGHNTGWTYFKATGSTLTFIAIATGLMLASVYAGSPEFREDLQASMTDQTIDIATEYTELAGMGGTGDTGAVQEDTIDRFATRLAENVSAASIVATEQLVLQTAEQSGSFDGEQQLILRSAFSDARRTIPQNISEQAADQLQTAIGRTGDTGEPQEMGVAEMVRPQVRGFLDNIVEPTREMQAVVFFAVFSLVIVFKIPFEMLGMLYAAILSSVGHRLL